MKPKQSKRERHESIKRMVRRFSQKGAICRKVLGGYHVYERCSGNWRYALPIGFGRTVREAWEVAASLFVAIAFKRAMDVKAIKLPMTKVEESKFYVGLADDLALHDKTEPEFTTITLDEYCAEMIKSAKDGEIVSIPNEKAPEIAGASLKEIYLDELAKKPD